MMRGDPGLGAIARKLRRSRGLTLAAVARRAGCSPSLLSQVETGDRDLLPWLARALDATYGTSGTLTVLAGEGYDADPGPDLLPQHHAQVLVQLPRQGIIVPVSRRELLAALGIGAVSSTLASALDTALPGGHTDPDLLAELTATVRDLQAAGRTLPPGRLAGPLTGQVAIIDALRRRAPAPLARDLTILQARCAESLSWMTEESGDLTGALYWTDRTQQWASAAGWHAMTAYRHVRRSMLAISHASDGLAAAGQAMPAFRAPGTPPRIRGMAAKQMAFGFALAGRPDESRKALDHAVHLISRQAGYGDGEEGPGVGQHSLDVPDLLMIYQATCDVYLGGGDSVITALAPRLGRIGEASPRTHAITQAKLAQAYAHAGEPATACELVLQALDGAAAVGSQSARSELCRVLPALARWPGREDVTEIRHRLARPG
jgi:transcriptional regulator with XRE-family HTH domain